MHQGKKEFVLHQGDQLVLNIPITFNCKPVTPDNIVGVKIRIADIQHEYPDGELMFDSETQKWLFPLTQEQTLKMQGQVDRVVQLNFGGDPATILSSDVETDRISKNIIKEVWDGD
jgi:hypothetical protein